MGGHHDDELVRVQTDDRHDTPDWHCLDKTEIRELRPARLAKTSITAISATDFGNELHRLPEPALVHLQQILKVRAGATVSVVTQSLRSRLVRSAEEEAAVLLLHALYFAIAATSTSSDLDVCELAALFTADPDGLTFLSDRVIGEPLLDIETFGLTPTTRTAAWSAMVSSGHPGSVAALGWLVAERPAWWTDDQRRVVDSVWHRVQYRLGLPPTPRPLTELVRLVNQLHQDGVLGGVTGADSAPDADLARLATLHNTVESLLRDIRAHDLPALNHAVEAGHEVPVAELHRLNRLAADLRSLFAGVAAATCGAAPTALDQAGRAIDHLTATLDRNRLLSRISQLTTLSAPVYVAAEAGHVSNLAAGVDADTDPAILAGLDALLTAIEIGPNDPARGADLARTVQATLPHAAPLVTVAAMGGLTVGTPPADATAPPLTSEAEQAWRDDVSAADGNGSTDAEVRDPVVDTRGPKHPVRPEELARPDPSVVAPGEPLDRGEPERPATQPATTVEEALTGLTFTVPRQAEPVEPHEAPAPSARSADHGAEGTDALYAALLSNRQYALAYWLLIAEAADPSVVAAHRLAACATAMRTSAGSNAAAFAETVKQLDADALHNRLDVQMLVYAASVRAGLLSPTAGAAGPLRDITTSIVKSGPAVESLTEALLTAIYNGVYLTPRSAGAVAEAAGVEAEHQNLAHAARNAIQAAQSRTIRYQAATELWQNWMAPRGYLGAPLTVVANGSRDPGDLGFVRGRIRDLRTKSTLETTLDQDTRRLAPAKRGRRIEARARDKILDWTADVTELLTRWVEVTENLTRPSAGTWMADPMAELRNRVNAVRVPALEELAGLATSGNGVRDAAVEAGLALLGESLEILDGAATLNGPEMATEKVIGGILTAAPDLPLEADLTPRRPVMTADVASAIKTISAGEAGWIDAFSARAARHDQVGTQILVEYLRPTEPQLAQRLSSRRDEKLAESTIQLDHQVTTLARQIDSDRRFGRMTADQWTELSTKLRPYGSGIRGVRRDYDVMLAEVAAIEQQRAAIVTEAIGAELDRLKSMNLTADIHARVANRIEEGDLTTASEYREMIRSGRELPGPHDDTNHLRLFFPVFVALFGAGGQKSTKIDLLNQLRKAIEAGRNPDHGPMADALASAGIDVSRIGRAKTAAARIDQWLTLAGARSTDSRLSLVRAILEQIGFFVDQPDTPRTRRGQSHGRSSWIHFTGVRATAGESPIPAFGTAISPSGDTLRLLAVWRCPTPQELVELLRNEPPDHAVVVLYFGTLDVSARRELANQFRSGRKLPVTAVIDDPAFAYLVTQPEPGRDVTMAITLPFTSATPFTPDVAGLVPQEMFYGRTEERDKVIDMMGSCIVYGGRQLGKSALLRSAARDFDDGDSRHAIYLSIYNIGQATPVEAVWPTLWPRLVEKGIISGDLPPGDIAAALTRSVSQWVMARPGRQLLLLLDESDYFLDADATDGRFTHVTQFKELMETTRRAVKVVFAGLHQTARFERLANHPLAHFGDPVCVGPLAPQAAYDLLTRPLHALGYEFGNSDHASRVLALSNNQPALIQLFGAQLLRNLQRVPMPPGSPPQHVGGTDVDNVWADSGLRTAFRKRFDWTLNLDPRYKVIAYAVAFHAHSDGVASALTLPQLRTECEQWWAKGFAAEDIRTGEFRALLDECVDLGVLSYVGGGYRLRTPNVLDLLGSWDEVDDFLEQASSMELPESFDGSLLRPAFGNSPDRGPLTSRQIADLLAPRNQVCLIAGSAALTVERCVRVLQDENNTALSGSRGSHLRTTTPSKLPEACRYATMQAAGRHAVVVVDLLSAGLEVAHGVWRAARELIATHSGGTLGIVLVTSPLQAPLWLIASSESDASSGLIELRRYDRTDLRLWLTETTLPFQDDASRGELLAVTGGWPINVNRLAEPLWDHDPANRVDPLSSLQAHLANPTHAENLVVSTGARADPALEQAWTCLSTELADGGADAESIAELLAVHAELGGPGAGALTPESLRASGYQSTKGVVEVLRILGLLVPNPEDGLLFVEPVVAAATRQVRG